MLDLSRWREWRCWVPAECPGCGRRTPGQGLCADCLSALLADPRVVRCPRCAHPCDAAGCPDCRQQPPAFDGVVAAFDYRGLGARLVRDYKLGGRLALASPLADVLATAVWPPGSVDWVVPVPSRADSLRQRGFSPPAEVARLLARRLHLRYRLDLLRRCRQGGPKQSTLERAERLLAAVDTYACDDGGRRSTDLQGSCVAVVDDVLTTGATLHEIARVLKQAGARQVLGWVLARAVLQ